ncbi:Protein of unknown function [Gryllus bimaculatus]|nr:Protein of unknown function [Gryllus bimaculatus]
MFLCEFVMPDSCPVNDKENLKIWVIAVKRKNFVPPRSTRICSDHFKDDVFSRPNINVLQLKKAGCDLVFHSLAIRKDVV